MFLIEAIKCNIEKKIETGLFFTQLFRGGKLGAKKIKLIFVPFRVKFVSSNQCWRSGSADPGSGSAYFYRDSDPQRIRNNLSCGSYMRILNIPSKYELTFMNFGLCTLEKI